MGVSAPLIARSEALERAVDHRIRKGFEKVTLEPGQSKRVAFALGAEQLRFHDGETWVLEPGRFQIWVAPNAASGLEGSFELR